MSGGLGRALLDFVLPLRCLGCGEAAGRGRALPVCLRCASGLPRLPEPCCPRCGAPPDPLRLPHRPLRPPPDRAAGLPGSGAGSTHLRVGGASRPPGVPDRTRNRIRDPRAPDAPRHTNGASLHGPDVPRHTTGVPGHAPDAHASPPVATPSSCPLCADWPPGLTARSRTLWRPPASRLVEALKYQGWTEIAGWMGERMAPLATDLRADAVAVAVPTPPARLRSRGFNPAERIASGLADRLGRPLVGALVRPVDGARQVGLPPDLRSANVRGAFLPEPRGISRVRGRQIILVDDVLTTGATAVEAARILLGEGADSVRVLTFARAAPHRPGELARAS